MTPSRREIHLRAHEHDDEVERLQVCEVCGGTDGTCATRTPYNTVEVVLYRHWLVAQIHESEQR